jgi:hypothetical protein
MATHKTKTKSRTRKATTKTAARSGTRTGTGKRPTQKRRPNEDQMKKPGTVSRRRPSVERKRDGEG